MVRKKERNGKESSRSLLAKTRNSCVDLREGKLLFPIKSRHGARGNHQSLNKDAKNVFLID